MRPCSELARQLEEARQKIEEGALYAHYKDPLNPYEVIGLAIIEASNEPSVLYRKEGDLAITWVRTAQSWLELVWHEGKQLPRFQKIAPSV